MDSDRLRELQQEQRELQDTQDFWLGIYEDEHENSDSQRIARHKALEVDDDLRRVDGQKQAIEQEIAEVEEERVEMLQTIFKPRSLAELLRRHSNTTPTPPAMPQSTAKRGGRRL